MVINVEHLTAVVHRHFYLFGGRFDRVWRLEDLLQLLKGLASRLNKEPAGNQLVATSCLLQGSPAETYQ